MPEKYKIHIDPKMPDREEMKKYKNPPRVMDDTKKIHQPGYIIRNLHRDRRLLRLIILIMIVLLTIFLTHEAITEKDQEKSKEEQTTPEKPDINDSK